jgi:hypothetical protein
MIVECVEKQTELLLLAQLTRESAKVPAVLRADFQHVLRLTPRLLEELMKVWRFLKVLCCVRPS